MKKTLATLLVACLLLPCWSVNVPKKMEASTVLLHMKVHVDAVGKDGWGACSGVYIKDNIILTAAHCVDMEEGVHVKGIWVKKGNESAQAVPVKVDSAADLALLYTPLRGVPVKFAHRDIRGEDCWVIGNPLGLRDVITKGIVSQVNLIEKDEKAHFIIVDAVALPGNSGGAVVDDRGHLIGILTRSTSVFGRFGASGLGLAVDLVTIRAFLKS